MKPDVLDPGMDLRNMLRNYLIGRSKAEMAKSKERRAGSLASGDVDRYRSAIRTSVRAFYGDMQEVFAKTPLRVSAVSQFDKDGYRIENVLFDTVPGMQVNATVYIPTNVAPPYPAVVVPVGHSGKQFINYQLPAQFFARSGYVAIVFDPPGQQSEKQTGNDHFIDGVRCYPVGHSSSRYFIGDALRCIDYLETRDDVDLTHGVAMTGVSGGGTTTTFALHLDDRITVAGPSCCVAPLSDLDIEQCYSGCPETHMWRRYAEGIDEVDLICAAIPRPVMLMAGRGDEVYRIEDTTRLASEVAEFYSVGGAPDRFEFFVDSSGHAYTLDQARQFTRFMNRWLMNKPEREVCDLPDSAFSLDPYDEIRCYPDQSVNMMSLSVATADALAARSRMPANEIKIAARELSGATDPSVCPESVTGKPFRTWMHEWVQVILKPEDGLVLPATYLRSLDPPQATILHFDQTHRDRPLYRNGALAQAAGFCDREKRTSSVFSVDLRGWGDTAPAMFPYEISGWGGVDRYLAYTSAALGDSIMGMRIRDGLSALAYLRSVDEIADTPIIVTGSGLGGIIALHVAAIARPVSGTVVWDCLQSVGELLATENYTWPADAFIPNLLSSYDLPDLAEAVDCPVEVVNPLDGEGRGGTSGATDADIIAAIERCIKIPVE